MGSAGTAPEVVIEPPYRFIWKQIQAGKVIPFLGAGASRVDASEIVGDGGSVPGTMAGAVLNCPPTGGELAQRLADEAEFPLQDKRDRSDLAKVSSYYVETTTRKSLREVLRQILNCEYPIGSIHGFLAEQQSIRLFVVTNYDYLLEEAFRRAGREYDLVVYPADRKDVANAVLWWQHNQQEPKAVAPNELFIDLTKTSVIYKMHGTVSKNSPKWDNFVITEEDYVEFLSRMTANTAIPTTLYDYSQDCSFLFLGYSLSDWNLRVLLRNMSKRLGAKKHLAEEDGEEVPSWAIQYNPSKLEEILWNKRNVRIYNMTVADFVKRMKSRR